MEYSRSFKFWENWYEMAESLDTDKKRLAFYDAIMKYAFCGEVPKRPVRGVSPDLEWAVWDAYVATAAAEPHEKTKKTKGKGNR